MFENKVAVITGGAQGIGKCIADEFRKNKAQVCIIDKLPNEYFTGDLADEEILRRFSEKVISDYGKVDYLINNALPLMKGIEECTYDEFNYALRVGVTAPFYLTKLFLPHFASGASIVNISSSRDRMSQPHSCSGCQPCRKSPGKLHFSGLDRHVFPDIHRSRRCPAACRKGRESHGYRKYGFIPLLGKSRIHYR